MAEELAHQSATELASAIRDKRVSSVELLELYLARIERLNPAVNAVVTLDAERARAHARTLDQELARGELRGPLHGVPMTIKDAYETEGLRTTGGARPYAQHVPARNATPVQRLVDAGAVVFGKTNVPAYSADVQSFNDIFGVTRNPYDAERTPGGSSGGAAVAVACGFSALELGSDIGGSIRTPASWTGVYGHKPSWGIVPMRGHVPWAPGAVAPMDLAVAGPLARTAEDLGLALDVLAGPDEQEARAYRLALPPPRAQSLAGYRVAAWLDDRAFPVEHEMLKLLERAIDALRGAGANIDSDARPDMTLAEMHSNYVSLLVPLMIAELPQSTLLGLSNMAANADEGPEELSRFARIGLQRHVDWLRGDERRARYRARWAAFFERYDILLCPVVLTTAIQHNHAGSNLSRNIKVNGETRRYMDLLGWISMATGGYLPATSAPIGKTESGLPVGLQIIGPYLEDKSTLDFAARIAEITGGCTPPPGY